MKKLVVLFLTYAGCFAMENPEVKKDTEPTLEQMQFTLDKLENAIAKVEALRKAESHDQKIMLQLQIINTSLNCANTWLNIRKDYAPVKRYNHSDEFFESTYGLSRDQMDHYPLYEKAKMAEIEKTLLRTDQR